MNTLLDGLLRRPRTIMTLLLFLLGAGIVSFITIPKEANPDIDVPMFYVSVTQQGISPEDAERLLVKPMETQLRGLDGLKEIRATASESHAGILLEFNADFDPDEAIADVRDKVDQAKAELPADADEPTITETNFSLVPTISVALSGDVPERTLYQHARRLKDQIEAIPTVLSADLSGHREEQLEVIINRTLMESYRLDPVELLTTLQRNNALVPAGFLDTGEGRFSVKVPGLIEDAQDVYGMVLKQSAEGVVTVGDIADVRRTFKDPTRYTRVNGRPAITIDVVKRLGENIIENNQAVKDVVASATADWPETIKVDYLLDQSNFIFEVLNGLNISIATAIVLVMIVVISSLGFRSAILVGISIPTSILLGFLTLSGLGMTVNMMVMFGLVLTVGMLVDGAIIMVEYAERRMAEGQGRIEAFVEASKLMAWPLISSTLTTLIAFLPMLLWPGMAGEFMAYLPLMVIIVLTVALVSALVFLPVLGGVLSNAVIAGLMAGGVAGGAAYVALAGSGPMQYGAAALAFLVGAVVASKLAHRWGSSRAKPVPLLAHGPFDVTKVRGATGFYVRTLRFFAGSVSGVVLTIVAVVGIAIGSVAAFTATSSGVEFFVDEEPDVAVAMVSARGNMSAREALALVRDVEREVLSVDGVENVITKAFPSGGNSGGGGGMNSGEQPADIIGELQIELVPYCCRREAKDIFEDIRAHTNFAGIKTEVREIEGGPPTGKDIQLQVTATNYDTLVGAVATVRDHVEKVEGLRDVEDDRPLPGIEWQLTVDREEAGRFGADVQTLGAMIQLVTNGVLLTQYQPDDSQDQLDVRARFPERERTLDQFADLRLQTAMGQVPVVNFIEVAPQQRVSAITRVDGLYADDGEGRRARPGGLRPQRENRRAGHLGEGAGVARRRRVQVPRRQRGSGRVHELPHEGNGRLAGDDVPRPRHPVQQLLPDRADAADHRPVGVRRAPRHGGDGSEVLRHHDRDGGDRARRHRGEQRDRADRHVQPRAPRAARCADRRARDRGPADPADPAHHDHHHRRIDPDGDAGEPRLPQPHDLRRQHHLDLVGAAVDGDHFGPRLLHDADARGDPGAPCDARDGGPLRRPGARRHGAARSRRRRRADVRDVRARPAGAGALRPAGNRARRARPDGRACRCRGVPARRRGRHRRGVDTGDLRPGDRAGPPGPRACCGRDGRVRSSRGGGRSASRAGPGRVGAGPRQNPARHDRRHGRGCAAPGRRSRQPGRRVRVRRIA